MGKLRVRLFEILLSLCLLEVCSLFALHQLERLRGGTVVDLFIEEHFSDDLDEYRREFVIRSFDSLLGWNNNPNTRYAALNVAKREWVSTIDADGARADGRPHEAVAVATYGDSMTFCSEVNDDETWPYYLENRIGLDVKNFGIVSYGSGQALLKFKRDVENGIVAPVTILSIFEENINRVVNAFRPFYATRTGVRLGFKPSFRLVNDQVVLRENPYDRPDLSVESLKELAYAASEWDYWSTRKPRIAFPYTFQLVKAIYFLLDQKFNDLWGKREGMAVMEFIVDDFVETSRGAGSNPVVLFIPTAETMRTGKAPGYARFAEELGARHPELSVIDVLDARFDKERFNVLPFAGIGHASPYGNRVIANLVYERLRAEGVLSAPASQRARP
jgi:hypothetical protein